MPRNPFGSLPIASRRPALVALAAAWCVSAAGDEPLLARWKLATDAANAVAGAPDGATHGVTFAAGGPDRPAGFAAFAGRGQHVEIPAARSLALGRGDFTIAAWIHTAATADEGGDIVSHFDPVTRTGLQLGLRTNSGVTSSQANRRQLQFGIDSGTEPVFTDEGRPGDAIFGQSMAVHDGHLYVGTCVSGTGSGRVQRYAGPGAWIDLGSPDGANSVTAMAAHDGALHVGTGHYRLGGTHLPEGENRQPGGRIFRLVDGARWEEIGHFPGMEAVGGMVVFQGKLHVASLYRPASFHRHEGGTRWTALPVPDGKRVEAIGVFEGALWATSYDDAHVYRYDGTSWTDMGQVGEPANTQCYAFANHNGRLQVATWRTGKVFEWDGAGWRDRGRLGEELEVMGMLVHNGSLYAGTLPLAWLGRHDVGPDGRDDWTLLRRLDTTPDVEYRRVWTLAQHAGRLFATTIPSGHVWSLRAGACVTWDAECPPGWRHVVAQRQGDVLRLFVDGRQVAESAAGAAASIDVDCDRPWLVGAGSGGFFNGGIADVTIHRRALGPDEIRAAAGRSAP